MSLSDQERTHGIYHAIAAMCEAVHRWETDRYITYTSDLERYRDIREAVKQLWHAFLAGSSNSLHWFMGSASSNTITDDTASDPWTWLLRQLCRNTGGNSIVCLRTRFVDLQIRKKKMNTIRIPAKSGMP